MVFAISPENVLLAREGILYHHRLLQKTQPTQIFLLQGLPLRWPHPSYSPLSMSSSPSSILDSPPYGCRSAALIPNRCTGSIY
nr:hypothetical protein Iba_chr07dCG7320 [Ipomoea batatas]